MCKMIGNRTGKLICQNSLSPNADISIKQNLRFDCNELHKRQSFSLQRCNKRSDERLLNTMAQRKQLKLLQHETWALFNKKHTANLDLSLGLEIYFYNLKVGNQTTTL